MMDAEISRLRMVAMSLSNFGICPIFYAVIVRLFILTSTPLQRSTEYIFTTSEYGRHTDRGHSWSCYILQSVSSSTRYDASCFLAMRLSRYWNGKIFPPILPPDTLRFTCMLSTQTPNCCLSQFTTAAILANSSSRHLT